MPSLAEDLMQLILDDETGRPIVDQVAVDNGLAGAVLLELANTGRVSPAGEGDDVKEGLILVRDNSFTGDAVLDNALKRLETKPVRGKRAVELLAKGTRDAVLERLAERGLVRRGESKFLGLFPRKSWPAVDTAHENELKEKLAAVLVNGAAPDDHIGGLIALLYAVGAVHKVVDGGKKELNARAKEIAESGFAGDAVKAAIRAVRASITAAIVAASSASAAAASGS